ncbi:uncharacterized protein BXZ73DRAFT_95918 [Epithele typhae]|uniref:uncharacterized protein n=1 Tax=Epithele typhae TaxID=378194 RepID=UPI002007F1D2|nr:uncharacterized protein BXZ73DRAFT_95918 [Epithele typhae]KAH9946420.1 hypothetical protein BXZ73DRAFT_95918 [Epithele typhae]
MPSQTEPNISPTPARARGPPLLLPATVTPAPTHVARLLLLLLLTPTFSTDTVLTTLSLPTFTTTTFTRPGAQPTAATSPSQPRSTVPVAAIAAGTTAGVLLALVAVVGWTWWGRCIKRKAAKQRKETLAFLQVRENTRKNASTSSRPDARYTPIATRDRNGRKVTFASSPPASSSQSTLWGAVDAKPVRSDAEKLPRATPRSRPPTPPAHLAKAFYAPEKSPPPPLPRWNPGREPAPIPPVPPIPPSEDASRPPHGLTHQASTLSSGSVYSTQSAMEERRAGVPSSLLEALTSEDTRRSLLANYLPWNRYRNSIGSNNRLSEYSTGSIYSQYGDYPWESMGFAYGGDDEQPRR